MPKLIVISILLVTFVAATWFSNAKSPKSALRKAQWIVVVYVFVWGYMCLNWYPQLVPVEPSVKREGSLLGPDPDNPDPKP
jgi:hypothetical protein